MSNDLECLPNDLKKHINSITNVSLDSTNNTSLVKSDFKVIDFDAVKDDYNQRLKSNDALFFTFQKFKGNHMIFIEFKNGFINDSENKQLFEKIYDSVNILSDIMCKNKFELMHNNPIEYFKECGCYILVYNSKNEPYNEKYMTKETQKGLSRQKYTGRTIPKKNFRMGIKRHLAKNANRDIVLFGLDFFRNYLFKNVYTYTEKEFQEKCLKEWQHISASITK